MLRLPLIAVVALLSSTGAAANAAQPDAWVTDGQVHAIAQGADGVAIGGNFTYVGPANGAGASLSTATGDAPAGIPAIDGSVEAVLPDGNGGWYVGGAFATIGATPRANLARILANGSVDPTFHPDPDGPVTALARAGTALYVGGGFAEIGGVDQARAAAVHATTGIVDGGWAPALGGDVDALATAGSTVFAGGSFGLAAVTAAAGSPVSFGGADGRVRALLVVGSTLYVGGQFTHVAGEDRTNAAAFALGSGDLLAWAPAPESAVRALASTGASILVGGQFGTIGGVGRNRLAAVGATSGLVTAWNPNVNGDVLALTVLGSTVYAGGSFSSVGGVPRRFLAALDTTTGEATAWAPAAAGTIDALASAGTTVYAGGNTPSVGGAARTNLARLSANGRVDRSWSANADGIVRTLALAGSTLYVGGSFATVGGQGRRHLAAVGATSGVVAAWDPDPDAVVLALATQDAVLYAGGEFASIGGASRANLAALDRADASAVAGWDPSPDGPVQALAIGGDNLYAGGLFANVGGQPRPNLAAVNLGDGGAAGWNPGADGRVRALAARAGTIYAGGDFATAGGENRDAIAALDAVTGAAIDDWVADANGSVHAIAVLGANVYAGGAFSTIGGATRARLAALAAATGGATAWQADANAVVRALAATHPALLVGGDFTTIAAATRTSFRLLDPAASPAEAVAAPAVVGTRVVGSTLTAEDGVWGGWPTPSITRRWQRCDAAGTPGSCTDTVATGVTYPLTLADAGVTIRLAVTATNPGGNVSQTSPITALITAIPVSTGEPEVDGTPLIFETLMASDGSWVGLPTPTLTRVWQRCDVHGTPASCVDQPQQGATYPLTMGDVGHTLRVLVTGTNDVGHTATPSGTTAPVAAPPSFSANPAITGTARVGATLTAADGFWEGYPVPRVSRSWQRCDGAATPSSCVDIGAIDAEYVIAQADAGSTLRLVVTATNSAGTRSNTSTATARITAAPVVLSDPKILGKPLIGARLDAVDGEWIGSPAPTTERVWQRCDARGTACKALPVRSTFYVPTRADLGRTLRLVVTATNEAGEAIASSPPTRVVTAPPPPVVTLALTSRTVAPNGTLDLRVRCPRSALAPCAPLVVLKSAAAVQTIAGGPRRVLTLASLRVRANPGATRRVTLRLSGRGLGVLRTARSLPLVLTATTTNSSGKSGVARLRFTATSGRR